MNLSKNEFRLNKKPKSNGKCFSSHPMISWNSYNGIQGERHELITMCFGVQPPQPSTYCANNIHPAVAQGYSERSTISLRRHGDGISLARRRDEIRRFYQAGASRICVRCRRHIVSAKWCDANCTSLAAGGDYGADSISSLSFCIYVRAGIPKGFPHARREQTWLWTEFAAKNTTFCRVSENACLLFISQRLIGITSFPALCNF